MVTWPQLQSSFMEDPREHWDVCQSRGLHCPLDVFTQLFHESVGTDAVPTITAQVDWAQVRWSDEYLAGYDLRQVYIDRQFAWGVEEAYLAALDQGITDERPAVIQGWQRQQSWIVPPVFVTGAVIGSASRHALLVGNTRLGNLLGLLVRGEVAPERRHRVWIGAPLELLP